MRTIITISDTDALQDAANGAARDIARVMELEIKSVGYEALGGINRLVDETDAALLIVGLGGRVSVQTWLNALRELRVPYIFVKDGHRRFDIKRVLLPVTNLMEEREKGPYASSFARHFGAEVTMLKPRDYGSMAQGNIDAIAVLFDKLAVGYTVVQAKKDSSKVEAEALLYSADSERELLIISASRDYGLDDLIFGPKERKIIQRAPMPVLAVNPRADLYPLCD